jgi:RND family efflux transporter MFP subunit
MFKTDAAPDGDGHASRFRGKGVTIGIGLALVLIVLGGGYYLFSGEEAASPAAPSHTALTVTTAAPQRVTWPDSLIAQGAIAPWEEASIGTQIGSYQLIEVRVNVGDQVRRGQVLARLNPALLRAEQAQLLARRSQAVANDQRARNLQAVGGMSDQEALQFSTEAKTAAALLAAKQLELAYTAIVAPDDGVISARTATLGAVVPAGQELFRMIRKNRLEWRGELTAAQLKTAQRGQAIMLTLPDGSSAQAVIREFAPALDATSRLGIAYADLAPGSRARAGMYVSGSVAVGESGALVIPAECVVIRDGRSYVMLVEGASTVSQVALRAVTTGRRRDNAVEILKGLVGGERLVRRGASFLDDGDAVTVADAGKGRS